MKRLQKQEAAHTRCKTYSGDSDLNLLGEWGYFNLVQMFTCAE